MNIKETSKKLLEAVAPFFSKHHFKLNKRSKEFKRNRSDCIQIVDFIFYKENGYIGVEPQIRIKIEPIEKVYRSISEIKDRPYCTLGNHLLKILLYIDNGEEIEKSNVEDWLVSDDNQLTNLTKVIPEYLEETILPYFEENSSITRVDELLNKYPRQLSIHNPIYPLRANIAIIAAKLNNNPQYNKLLGVYEEELQEAENTYKQEFFRIKEHLGSMN